jgi:hypothetical protein
MKSIRVSNIRRTICEFFEISAEVDGLGQSPNGSRLWFRFPAAMASWATESAEAFVAALLPTAMVLNRRLEVQGHVSPLFRSGCEQILHQYHVWDKRLHEVELDVATTAPACGDRFATGCFFTCGVDSFYTVLKNLQRERGDGRITHLIYIRGYADCPLDNEVLFQNLAKKLTTVASGLNLEFVPAATNLRSFTSAPASSWDWHASSQLASAGLCLGGGLRRLIIPGGDTYSTLSPWGSHPLIDPLWSTESLEFRHDGCEAFRSQKLDWYVARSRVALENLRVCGYESSGLQNCGRCEKCLRTMIGLAALGAEMPAGLFGKQLDLDLVRQLNGANRVIGYYLRDNLKLLGAGVRHPELEEAVRSALHPALSSRIWRSVEVAGREVDRRYLKGRVRSWALARAGRDAESQSGLRLSPSRWMVREAWHSAGRGRLVPASSRANRKVEEAGSRKAAGA